MSDASPPLRESRARLSQFYGLDSEQPGTIQLFQFENLVDSIIQGAVAGSRDGAEGQLPGRKVSHKSNASRKPSSNDSGNPLDINNANFDPELFVNRLISEASLSQLMAQEGEIVRQIQGLDSDMQTLVYENYNKFIAATETIRKMRVDFRSMEEEMDQLASSMTSITAFSSNISDKLRVRRQEVARLSSTNTTLQKLQFVLELPQRLKVLQKSFSLKHFFQSGKHRGGSTWSGS